MKTAEAPGVGRIVSLGALVLLGTVIVLGAASLTALLAGYDPPGHEEQARRLRRYAREHRPNLSGDTFRPIGEQIDRGEKWARSALKRAVG